MFNVIYTIYNPKQEIIDMHLNIWKKIPDDIRKDIKFIVVDDCSPHPTSFNIDFPINLVIPRVDIDIYWNPPGAKNLGFTIADNDWIFSSDIDHTVSAEDYVRMYTMKKERNSVYFFKRFLPNGNSRNKDAPNILLIHKEDFWKTGGYDEDFSGNHGYDDYFIIGNFYNNEPGIYNTDPSLMRLLNFKYIMTDLKVIEHKEFETGDKSIKTFSNAKNLALVISKIKQLKEGTYQHTPILRFPWHIEKENKFS